MQKWISAKVRTDFDDVLRSKKGRLRANESKEFVCNQMGLFFIDDRAGGADHMIVGEDQVPVQKM